MNRERYEIGAWWCNNDSADLTVMCTDCPPPEGHRYQRPLVEWNSTDDGQITLAELLAAIEAHEAEAHT